MKIATLLRVILAVSVAGTALVSFGALEHQAVTLTKLEQAVIYTNLLTTSGKGVTQSEILYGAGQIEVRAQQSANGVAALLGLSGALGTIREQAAAHMEDSETELERLASSPLVGADVRRTAGELADALHDTHTKADAGVDISGSRAAVLAHYQALVRDLTSTQALSAHTSALVDLTNLNCLIIETAVNTYLPEKSDMAASERDAITANAIEQAVIAQLATKLPEGRGGRFAQAMSTGNQASYNDNLQIMLAAYDSPQTQTMRLTGYKTITDVLERLAIVSSEQDALGRQVISEANQRHDHEKNVAYIYVLGAVVAAGVTHLMIVVVAHTIKRRLRDTAAHAEAVASGSIGSVPTPSRVANELDQIDAALSTASNVVAQVSQATSAITSGDSIPDIDIPGDLGSVVAGALERVVQDRTRLVNSLQLVGAIIDNAPTAIWTVNPEGFVTRANSAALALAPASGPGTHHREFLDIALTEMAGTEAVVRSEGTATPVVLSVGRVSNADSSHVVIAHDISERKRFEDVLANMAVTDALTKLPNRSGITDALEQLTSAPTETAVLFIDLDKFKAVNDTYGHAAGDELLVSCARRITKSIKPGDLAGRLSGDEFVVILNDVTIEGAVRVAERILGAVKAPYQLSCGTAVIGASIGVVTTGCAAQRNTDILAAADAAMYAAKTTGRGRVMVYDTDMAATAVQRAKLENDLRAAVASGELTAVYQPIVKVADLDIAGYEMLVRWNNRGEDIPPSVFIPIAEEIGAVTDIGMFTVRTAVAYLAARHDHDGRYISVNISAAHLAKGTLADDILGALNAAGVDGEGLVVEVTETSMVTDLDGAIRQLNRLRDAGVTVSLDDFGTGYASLNYLRSLPADILKIDKSFITGGVDREIIGTIVALAGSLGLTVVAEGVETEDELEAVADLGCHCAQGFLLGAPAPAPAATAAASHSAA